MKLQYKYSKKNQCNTANRETPVGPQSISTQPTFNVKYTENTGETQYNTGKLCTETQLRCSGKCCNGVMALQCHCSALKRTAQQTLNMTSVNSARETVFTVHHCWAALSERKKTRSKKGRLLRHL